MTQQLYKILGQNSFTEDSLYEVPAGASAVISTLVICNRDGTDSTFRIAVIPSGQYSTSAGWTFDDMHYVCYDTKVCPNDSIALTLGITMASGDVIYIRSTTGNMSFSAFGSEVWAVTQPPLA